MARAGRSHQIFYAESTIMPSLSRRAVNTPDSMRICSPPTRHNLRLAYRLRRNSRRLSFGWKRAIRPSNGVVFAKAASLSARLASK